MNRGQRARQEVTLPERPAPPESAAPRSPALLASELRVVRWADTEPSLDTDDWNNFISDVGRRNYGVGEGRSLGSVAITLVPAREMGRMLQERYPDVYRDPHRIQRLHRRVRERINNFVQESIQACFEGRTREMESAYELGSRDMLVGFSNDLEDDYIETTWDMRRASPERGLVSQKVLQESVIPLSGKPIPFHAGTFKTPRIQLFGPGYAVDLSSNDTLVTERREMLAYLKEGEGLNTRILERDGWEPHATIFSFQEHIRGADVGYRRQVPQAMGFEAVQAVIPPRAATTYS